MMIPEKELHVNIGNPEKKRKKVLKKGRPHLSASSSRVVFTVRVCDLICFVVVIVLFL
jgi:hypothetical protein